MKDSYPGLIVFDLDFTIWDCGGSWIDATCWPFTNDNGKVQDSEGREFRLYPDVLELLDKLDETNVRLALASRTMEPEWAEWLLDAWNLTDRFHHREIYPDSKLAHFQKLKKQTKLPYEKMLFFDDEGRNIKEVGKLGVTCVQVLDGMHHELFQAGLERWREEQKAA